MQPYFIHKKMKVWTKELRDIFRMGAMGTGMPKPSADQYKLRRPIAPTENPFERPVLVHSSCYRKKKKCPQSRWLINNRNLLLLVLEDWSLRRGCWQGRNLVKVLFPIADHQCLIIFSQGSEQRGSKLSSDSHSWGLHPYDPTYSNYVPTTSPPNTNPFVAGGGGKGCKASTYEFGGGHKHSIHRKSPI